MVSKGFPNPRGEGVVLLQKLGAEASKGGCVPDITYEDVGLALAYLNVIDRREDPVEGFAKGFHRVYPRTAQAETPQAPAPDLEELARLIGQMKEQIRRQEEGQRLSMGSPFWRMRDTLDKMAAIVSPQK